MESWALKAIEDAALGRAMQKLGDQGYLESHLRIFDLNMRQVIWLRNEWRRKNPGIPIPEDGKSDGEKHFDPA